MLKLHSFDQILIKTTDRLSTTWHLSLWFLVFFTASILIAYFARGCRGMLACSLEWGQDKLLFGVGHDIYPYSDSCLTGTNSLTHSLTHWFTHSLSFFSVHLPTTLTLNLTCFFWLVGQDAVQKQSKPPGTYTHIHTHRASPMKQKQQADNGTWNDAPLQAKHSKSERNPHTHTQTRPQGWCVDKE